MSQIKVTDWVSYEATEKLSAAVGGMGGWFNSGSFNRQHPEYVGLRWKDYLDSWADSAHPYLEAIRAAVIEDALRTTGEEHQHNRCPVFSDGKCAAFSYRGWGDLMAAIWSGHENKDYSYMDFYM